MATEHTGKHSLLTMYGVLILLSISCIVDVFFVYMYIILCCLVLCNTLYAI